MGLNILGTYSPIFLYRCVCFMYGRETKIIGGYLMTVLGDFYAFFFCIKYLHNVGIFLVVSKE